MCMNPSSQLPSPSFLRLSPSSSRLPIGGRSTFESSGSCVSDGKHKFRGGGANGNSSLADSPSLGFPSYSRSISAHGVHITADSDDGKSQSLRFPVELPSTTRASRSSTSSIFDRGRQLRKNSTQILQAAAVFISFIVVYSLNPSIHIQPLIGDLLDNVHINTLYRLESSIFHFHLSEFLSKYHSTFCDVLAAIPYLLHYLIPVLFPLFLVVTDRVHDIAKFYRLLGTSVWFQYLIWLIFPHAAPWVLTSIAAYFDDVDVSKTFTPAIRQLMSETLANDELSIAVFLGHREGAAFHRLDAVLRMRFFHNLFAGSAVPFAAFPSGHVAWASSVWMTGGPGGGFFTVYVVWLCWATMYSSHHYFFDVLGGMLSVLAADILLKLSVHVLPAATTSSNKDSARLVSGRLVRNDGMEFEGADGDGGDADGGSRYSKHIRRQLSGRGNTPLLTAEGTEAGQWRNVTKEQLPSLANML